MKFYLKRYTDYTKIVSDINDENTIAECNEYGVTNEGLDNCVLNEPAYILDHLKPKWKGQFTEESGILMVVLNIF